MWESMPPADPTAKSFKHGSRSTLITCFILKPHSKLLMPQDCSYICIDFFQTSFSFSARYFPCWNSHPLPSLLFLHPTPIPHPIFAIFLLIPTPPSSLSIKVTYFSPEMLSYILRSGSLVNTRPTTISNTLTFNIM